jgi:hypothetical protein
MSTKERKRGNWGRLAVDWNVSLRRTFAAGLTKRQQEQARLSAVYKAFQGRPVPSWARINTIGWANPEAGEKGERKEVNIRENPEFLVSYAGFPTLNRGGWMSARLYERLERLGGELSEELSSKRKAKPKRRIKRQNKKVGHLGRKKAGPTKKRSAPKSKRVQTMGNHRRTQQRKKAALGFRQRRKP